MTGRNLDVRAETAGGLAGLLPGGPLMQAPVGRFVQEALHEWGRLKSPALEAAERACGKSREDIAEQLESEPHLIPLAARILFHAGMTNQDEVLEALGAMLGALILSKDDTDEVELIVMGLGDWRRVHLQVLRVMEGPPHARTRRRQTRSLTDTFEAALEDETPDDLADDELVTLEAQTWNAAAIAESAGLSMTRTELALAGLQKSGFLWTPTVVSGPGYLISDSGRTVIRVLREYQTQAPPQGLA
ncbi:hypothetical protein FE634_02290 [Nocardioides dongxiaopingii]|uniref:hypothetical protein n=1 Tax=Nocardioides sp. S-1144 TaxID=2582905 RepID=UPI00110E8B55|nr:hypothetical protein [Nocardioides sp. S-1144]QCW49534.1 hypothetical protein FE634_02290 [Nocardioides sp. S-1144]